VKAARVDKDPEMRLLMSWYWWLLVIVVFVCLEAIRFRMLLGKKREKSADNRHDPSKGAGNGE
jgi:hypothetical protein